MVTGQLWAILQCFYEKVTDYTWINQASEDPRKTHVFKPKSLVSNTVGQFSCLMLKQDETSCSSFNHTDPDQHLSLLVVLLGFCSFNKLLCLDFKDLCHNAPLLKPANCPALQGPDDPLLSPLRILPARIASTFYLTIPKAFQKCPRGRHLGETKHGWAR